MVILPSLISSRKLSVARRSQKVIFAADVVNLSLGGLMWVKNILPTRLIGASSCWMVQSPGRLDTHTEVFWDSSMFALRLRGFLGLPPWFPLRFLLGLPGMMNLLTV